MLLLTPCFAVSRAHAGNNLGRTLAHGAPPQPAHSQQPCWLRWQRRPLLPGRPRLCQHCRVQARDDELCGAPREHGHGLLRSCGLGSLGHVKTLKLCKLPQTSTRAFKPTLAQQQLHHDKHALNDHTESSSKTMGFYLPELCCRLPHNPRSTRRSLLCILGLMVIIQWVLLFSVAIMPPATAAVSERISKRALCCY